MLILATLVPLTVLAFMYFLLALPGLVLSPIAGLIAWRSARSSWLNGGREALAAVVYSICLILPWILLVVALRRGHLSGSTVHRY